MLESIDVPGITIDAGMALLRSITITDETQAPVIDLSQESERIFENISGVALLDYGVASFPAFTVQFAGANQQRDSQTEKSTAYIGEASIRFDIVCPAPITPQRNVLLYRCTGAIVARLTPGHKWHPQVTSLGRNSIAISDVIRGENNAPYQIATVTNAFRVRV